MGSLMAGWNSPTLNSKQGGYARSSSFTKYEIEEFKNKQKLAEEEHHKAAVLLAAELTQAHQDISIKVDQRKKAVQADGGEPSSAPLSVEEELERLNSFKDWWTKSSWAFLNDPAMKRMEAANHKYKAQFHVAAPASPPKSH
ncbi:hypothetical protein GOP47_0017566 [Adiantum capillus-veneris]|uniref:Uncharacterized protein n=1 Tax=Adiantum capillus-veneris TaxID=13818 RepID=A0A9D4UGH0_ADICA|nr:hypothetical protein GOP47_0017566 [Adiantum capillus-veneris]